MDDLVGYRRDAMKLALVLGISDGQKQSINGLIEKLAAKQDINK